MALYQVLRGRHAEGGVMYGRGCPAGDIVDSKSDLLKLNNAPGTPRFRKLDDDSGADFTTELRRAEQRVTDLKKKQAEATEAATTPEVPLNQGAAPGGQVSSGKQQTMGLPGGGQTSGPLVDKEALTKTREEQDKARVQTQAAPTVGRNAPPANLDRMSFKELEQYAADEEIDLKGAKSKEDALRVIKSTR
jgi:hypothetical protein